MSDGLIDLSQLTPPDFVTEPGFEAVLSARIEKLRELFDAAGIPYDADALESDPAVILQEADAYRELLVLAALNDAYRSTLLAFAAGADLDHLGATLHLLPRLPGEADARYRKRIELEAQNRSGGRLPGYRAEAMRASLDVADAGAYVDRASGAPVVRIPIMVADGDGVPGVDLLLAVQTHLGREDVRQATDVVVAEPVRPVPVTVEVVLEHLAGPDPAVLRAKAAAALDRVIARRRAPGRDLPRSALIAAAAVEGVERVVLTSPGADVIVGPGGLLDVVSVSVTSERVDG